MLDCVYEWPFSTHTTNMVNNKNHPLGCSRDDTQYIHNRIEITPHYEPVLPLCQMKIWTPSPETTPSEKGRGNA